MNSEYTPSSDKSFLPITLISVSLIFFFAWQWKIIAQNSDNIKNSKTKLEEFVQTNIPELDKQVQKSKQGQEALQKMVVELLDIAKTDADAKAIVTKYNIQQQAPPAGAPASATP